MPPTWIRENPPYWDGAKSRIVGGVPAGTFRLGPFRPGDPLPGDWWRVEEDGTVLAYGWMDRSWGEGEVLLAVDPKARNRGLGAYILDRLEAEARREGLNYIHNQVEPLHPDRAGVTRWLMAHGFADAGDGRLKRRVKAAEGMR